MHKVVSSLLYICREHASKMAEEVFGAHDQIFT